MRFFFVLVCLFLVACGESHRGDEDFTPERALSDTGLSSFDAEVVDASVAVDAIVESVDAQSDESDIDVDASALPVDAQPVTPDASPEVDAQPVDALPPNDDASFEDAEPDSPDSADVQPSDVQVEDASLLDVDTPPDAGGIDPDAGPTPDEGVPVVDAQVDADPVVAPTPPLCENAGVRFESITHADGFLGELEVSLDYDNWVGLICYDGECHEGVLDPPNVRYPTALITDRYRVDWSYMLGAGQLEHRITVSEPNGDLVVELTGLMGPAGVMRSAGTFDDFGRHYGHVITEVDHPDREHTWSKIPGGLYLIIYATCRPDRGP